MRLGSLGLKEAHHLRELGLVVPGEQPYEQIRVECVAHACTHHRGQAIATSASASSTRIYSPRVVNT